MLTRPLILALLAFATVSISAAAEVRFFDPKLFKLESCRQPGTPIGELDTFRAERYGKALTSAQEPSLYEHSLLRSPAKEFRFTWLPSFAHPIVVRVIATQDGPLQLIAKELSGVGGYDPGGVARRVDRALSAGEASMFRSALNAANVFRLPSTRCEPPGLDGEEWIFEAADSSGYRFARRWSPRRGPARELGQTFMKLTGWAIPL